MRARDFFSSFLLRNAAQLDETTIFLLLGMSKNVIARKCFVEIFARKMIGKMQLRMRSAGHESSSCAECERSREMKIVASSLHYSVRHCHKPPWEILRFDRYLSQKWKDCIIFSEELSQKLSIARSKTSARRNRPEEYGATFA